MYNEEGLKLTLDEIAGRLGLTKGRITNYFPRKEDLLLAILQNFDDKADRLYRRYQNEDALLEFSGMVKYYQEVMDLQYRYRFAMSFVAVQPIGEPELQAHIEKRYRKNRANLKERVAFQVETGSLKEELLNPATFEVFCFQLYNLLTTWVVSLQLYYPSEGYEKMKPVFLRGIMNCYTPHLSEKGERELEEALRKM